MHARFEKDPGPDWAARHQPTIDRWLDELEAADDPLWESAEHAAKCLVDYPDFYTQGRPAWDVFHPGHFLFRDMWESGTITMFGTASVFLEHAIEALRRFVADDLIDPVDGQRWISEMRDARHDFVRCYDEATPEEDSITIARRYYTPNVSGLPPTLIDTVSGAG